MHCRKENPGSATDYTSLFVMFSCVGGYMIRTFGSSVYRDRSSLSGGNTLGFGNESISLFFTI